MTTIQTSGAALRPMTDVERAHLAARVRRQAEADALNGQQMVADMLSAAQLIAYEPALGEGAWVQGPGTEIDPAEISTLTRETYVPAFLAGYAERLGHLEDIIEASGVPDPLNSELEQPGRYLAVQRGRGDYQGLACYSPGVDAAAAIERARPAGPTWQVPEVYDLADGEPVEEGSR